MDKESGYHENIWKILKLVLQYNLKHRLLFN